MFTQYKPELLPDLVEVFNRFADRSRGLDGFRQASHWEAVFSRPDIDPRQDILILSAAKEDIGIGISSFAWLYTKSPSGRVYLRGPFADPDAPDLDLTLATMLEKAHERAKEVDAASIEGRSLFPSWETAYLNAGFALMGAYCRYRLFPVMGAIPVPDNPPGGVIKTWKDFRNLGKIMDLFTSAFEDHWDYQPATLSEWEEIIKGNSFNSDLLLIGIEDKKPVGYIFGQTMTDHSNPEIRMAYLVSVGIHPDHQGRGWGRALLARWLRSVYKSDARAVELDVDIENTRAMSLYKSLGFRFLRQEDVFRKSLR